MGRALERLKKKKAKQNEMADIWQLSKFSWVIHYSCESFYDVEYGKTPRTTSIAVRNLKSGQTMSFSIHKIAEQEQISFERIDEEYDKLEKRMLTEYFDFVKTNNHANWIHWNMRDINYGFAAIEHRFRVLKKEPIIIYEDKKFDLSRALTDIYGPDYIDHPRLQNIIFKNKITHKDLLSGKAEADAFKMKNFVPLHRSTLRKVEAIAIIFERTINESIKTNITFLNKCSSHPKIIVEVVKDHWLWSFFFIIGVIIAHIAGFIKFVLNFFK